MNERPCGTALNRMRLALLLLAVLLGGVLQAQDGPVRVKYLSAQNVYLDAGRQRGLREGQKLIVQRDGRTIAELVVRFVADHSASCERVSGTTVLKVGDRVLLPDGTPINGKGEAAAGAVADSAGIDSAATERPSRQRTTVRRSRSRGDHVSGSASVQFYRLDDRTDANLDFSQPTMRLNLRVRELWNRPYTLRIRTRSRYNVRSRAYSDRVPKTEWRNRLYELSLNYEPGYSRFLYRVGRLVSNELTGVGYLDGIQLQSRIGGGVAAGVLAGTQPDWRNSAFQTTIQKYAGYVSLEAGERGGQHFEATAAGVGEYNSGTVSREFMYVQTRFNAGRKLYLYQSAEMDINRDWRKEKSGSGTSLTSWLVTGRYQVTDALAVGLSFDNRQNYWTYEIRSLADSLFDDALRLGLRGNVSLRLPGQFSLYGNTGYRKRDGDPDPTWSYAGGMRKGNFLRRGLAVGGNLAGFSSAFTEGLNAAVSIGQYFRAGQRVDIGYGRYEYRLKSTGLTRRSQWARLNLFVPVLRRWFLSGQYEYDWGDDLEGNRYLVELGYRF